MIAVSSEVKNAKRALPIALFLADHRIIFWGISSTPARKATGSNWMSAVGYLFDTDLATDISALAFPPSMSMFLSLIAHPNQMWLSLIAVSFVLGSFPTPFYFWIPSRFLFAWSFDRIIPSKMSDVNERFRTPHFTILAITFISATYLMLINFTSWPPAISLSTLIWFSSFILPSIAVAAVHTRRRRSTPSPLVS